jgi:hypothetical protein
MTTRRCGARSQSTLLPALMPNSSRPGLGIVTCLLLVMVAAISCLER